MDIKFKKVHPCARVPERMTEGAIGFDLYVPEDIYLPPGKATLIPSGVAFDLPKGYYATVHLRSSMCKLGLVGSTGVIDNDFKGMVFVQAFNLTDHTVAIMAGERVGQILFHKYVLPELVETHGDLTPTKRGDGGFGSTGK